VRHCYACHEGCQATRALIEGRYRVFIDILRNKGAYPNARCFAGHNGPQADHRVVLQRLSRHGPAPAVIAAMEEALHDVGAGSGGTRNIGGNTHYHIELEPSWPTCTARKARCCSPAGYVSNEATLSTLASCCRAASSSPTS
jgi:5-aminolevulinate synthase